MKKSTILIVFILLIQIGYCNSNSPDITNPQTNKVEPFKEFLDKFIKVFNEKNTTEINKYIYSDFGLFVLDNPGAFWVVERFNSFSEIMNLNFDYNIGSLKNCTVDCNFNKGSIPYYNCDNESQEGWNKEGCFYDKHKTNQITKLYKLMLEYNLGDVHTISIDLKIAEKSQVYISHLAYSTYNGIGFYFGIINNNWYLICIDKITPCSA